IQKGAEHRVVAVFRARQERALAEAKAKGFDALVVLPSTNYRYLTSTDPGRSERLIALILRPAAPATLVTPSFEEERVKADAVADRAVSWPEHEDPAALAAKLLSGAKRIGLEGTTDVHTVERLRAATGVPCADASAVFDALRSVKSEAEKGLIRDAAARTVAAIEATWKRLREGMTEQEVGEILSGEFRKLLVRGGGLVQFGASASLPHGGPGERRLRRGDVVLMDCGCRVRGYSSDVTRTAAFGPPADEVRKVYAAVDGAQRAGFAAFRGGAIPEEVDRAARKVIEEAGYGEFFTHRLGHGLGLDGHESPYLVRGNRVPLVPGNVCTIEPGAYLPGRFGVRIEDDAAATERGHEALSARPPELLVLAP
ncbi:MAG TPA: Xaa-Pro peptidase family protein, partial [Thermoanaerobaculia bacterium]|nr:Xaa-Pro peptidase family protein [Thermoanaerobaculia bacterium]